MDLNVALHLSNEKRNKKLIGILERLEKLGFIIQVCDDIAVGKDYNAIEHPINDLILEFMTYFETQYLKARALTLRVGIFYSREEMAFLCIDFSKDLLNTLNEYNIDVEINVYQT